MLKNLNLQNAEIILKDTSCQRIQNIKKIQKNQIMKKNIW